MARFAVMFTETIVGYKVFDADSPEHAVALIQTMQETTGDVEDLPNLSEVTRDYHFEFEGLPKEWN